MKITLLCSRLDLPGGIERAIANTANLLASFHYEITLLLLEKSGKSFFTLNKTVSVVQSPLTFGIEQNGNPIKRKMQFIGHVQKLRKEISRLSPDVVIATDYSYAIPLYFACARKGIPLFSWEHHHFGHLTKSRFWHFMQKRIYPKLTAVICLNEAEAAHYKTMNCKTVVIPNFCTPGIRSSLQVKNLLTVGWLSRTKGVDLIPAIAEKIFAKAPDWQWTIIGTGDEEAALKTELRKRNLLPHVAILSPLSSDLSSVYLNSSLYVMTSRLECFPMVLLEAMSHGVPCIAFDCPTGPRYIINNGNDGLLVEPGNVNAMADAIISLMEDEEKRRAFGNAAHRNIDRFSPDKIFALWEEHVLNKISSG